MQIISINCGIKKLITNDSLINTEISTKQVIRLREHKSCNNNAFYSLNNFNICLDIDLVGKKCVGSH